MHPRKQRRQLQCTEFVGKYIIHVEQYTVVRCQCVAFLFAALVSLLLPSLTNYKLQQILFAAAVRRVTFSFTNVAIYTVSQKTPSQHNCQKLL